MFELLVGAFLIILIMLGVICGIGSMMLILHMLFPVWEELKEYWEEFKRNI